MAKQNRNTLKNFFKDGSLPSAGQFGELIDSTLNIKDEGFRKSHEHGFEVSTLGGSTGLLSFFSDDQPLNPLWSVRLDEDGQKSLLFSARPPDHTAHDETDAEETNIPTLTLSPNGRVGVQTESPGCTLDINGTMRCTTRLGQGSLRAVDESTSRKIREVPADGEWHNLTAPLIGCQALEIVAGVGGPEKSGQYALVQAIALNTFGPTGFWFNLFNWKNRIRCRHAWHRSRSDRLVLRWYVPKPPIGARKVPRDEQVYFLQIRTRKNYRDQEKTIRINYHITHLWSDPMMTQSWNARAED